MRVEIKRRLHNIASKPAWKYGSKKWILRAQDGSLSEAPYIYFMRELVGKTRGDRIRNQDIQTQLGDVNIFDEIFIYIEPCNENTSL